MTMDGDSIWGSRDYQVPQYFNFADVIDDWAAKEKVTGFFNSPNLSHKVLPRDKEPSFPYVSKPSMRAM